MADDLGSAAGMIAGKAVEGNLLDKINQMENRIAALEGANTVMADVGEITDDLGDVRAGRILALTTGYEPTDSDATGVVIDAAGVELGSDTYNIVGLNNGALMFGLSAIDGKAYFMGGTAIVDDGGLQLSGLGDLITMRADNGTGVRYATIGMQTGVSNPAITIQSYEPVFGSTVIANGTFEGDTPETSPANWTCVGLTATVKSPSAGHSTQFVYLLGDGTFTSDYFPVTAGTLYYYSVPLKYARISGSGSTGFGISTVEYYDSSYNYIKSSLVPFSKIFETAPSGAAYGRIIITISNYNLSDTVTIDNVSVKPQTSVTIPATVSLDPYLKVTGTADFSGTVSAQTYRGVLGTQTYPTYSFQELIYFKNKSSYAVAPPAGFTFLFSKSDGLYINLSGTASQSRLALASEIPTLTYPKRFAVMGDEITTAVANWGFSAVASMQYGGFWTAPGANSNDGDEYTFGAYLCAGTCTLYHLGRKASDKGIIDWYIDGSAITGGANRDWYAATPVTYIDSFSVTVAASGYHVFKAKVDGHNKSSSDYNVAITKIWLKQATD